MLSFFRRLINSRVGVIVTFGVLIVIALAFAASDITGLSSGTGGLVGSSVAKVDGESVGAADIRRRAQEEVQAARQQQPTFDLAQFVATGGVEALVERSVNSLALEAFGKDEGLAVSRALVGSELRNIPAFRGMDGRFDQQAYQRLIAQRGMTDAQVQAEIARETMAQFLMVPTVGASQVPAELARPYASLLLEERSGEVAMIPAAAVPAPAPATDAEVQQWYRRNIARYTIPERRVLRYATMGPAQVAAQAAPSEAEIAAAYRADQKSYAAKELRDVTLVTVLQQSAAQALATRVRGGTALADAARAAGLQPRTIAAQEKAALTAQTSATVADALFAAPSGGVIGPIRGQIGYVVGRVDKITTVAQRTLPQVRDEITQRLRERRTADALSKVSSAVDDALGQEASFNEVVADNRLQPVTTPPLLPNGTQPGAAQPADPRLAPIVAAGFAAEEGDTPTLVPLGQDGSFAVVALDRVVRAAPVPLTQVRAQITADIAADKRRRAAREVARTVAAKAGGAASLAAALSQTKLSLPAPRPLQSARAAVNADPRRVDPALALLFSQKPGEARILPAPQGGGWMVVKLARIVPGDARKRPGVVDITRRDIGRVIGREYARQFAAAVVAHVGARRDADAIARLKQDLAGQNGSEQ